MRFISICSILILLALAMPCRAAAEFRSRESNTSRHADACNGKRIQRIRSGSSSWTHHLPAGIRNSEPEWNISKDVNTKFEIGSMTKQFTAVLILKFVNQGKIRREGYLSDYVPYYRKDTGSRVTINELLSHTSGVPSFTDLPGFLNGPASRVHHAVREFLKNSAAATSGLSRRPNIAIAAN